MKQEEFTEPIIDTSALLEELRTHLVGFKPLKGKARDSERALEGQINSHLNAKTGKYDQQFGGESKSASAFGTKHRPDGVFDRTIAVEVKKIDGSRPISNAIQVFLGQALCYLNQYDGVMIIVFDYTGKLLGAEKEDGTIKLTDRLKNQNIDIQLIDCRDNVGKTKKSK